MFDNGYDSNNLFGGYNSLSNDSLSNALNNSGNSTGAYFNSKMHDDHYRIKFNSEPVFQGSNNFGNDNTRNSLFNTRVSQSDEFIQVPSFDRNYAPASLDYKKTSPKVSPTHLWNPFSEQLVQTDSNSSNSNSSTHLSPTNGDQSFNFHNSNFNRTS
jgi:hypothetical protein